MEKIISEEKLNKIMSLKGKVRGVVIRDGIEYVLKEKGQEGVQKLEEAMEQAGYPIKYQEIRLNDFYPIGYQALTLELIKRVLGFDKKEFQKMGEFTPKFSILIKIFMKYFISMDRLAKEVPKMWKKHYTVGNINILEMDQEKKRGTIRIENFECHPLHCQSLVTYLPTIVQMVIGEKVECKETKCVHRGDNYHEFLLQWGEKNT